MESCSSNIAQDKGIDNNECCCRCRRGAVVKGVEHISENCVSQHLGGAGSSLAVSVGRDLNFAKTQLSMLNLTKLALR